ncbi:MAG: plasmid stabilization protein [Pseudomonadota bacterium]
MAAVTIRNLSDDVHRALKRRAAEQGRSTEAEMRAILEAAVLPPERLRLGSALAALGGKAGLTEADIEAVNATRHTAPAEPMRLE